MVMVEAIRANKNRFIKTMPFFVGETRHAYPQLIHWILSFFPSNRLLTYSKYIGSIGHLMSGALLLFFVHMLWGVNQFSSESNHYFQILMVVGLIYSLSPIHYDPLNAKNTGLSARGFGLALGQLFTYINFLFLLTSNLEILVFSALIAYLILITNVFAMQYLIFYSIIAPIFFQSAELIFPGLIGLSIFFLLHTSIAVEYFKGQYSHKKLYANHMAKGFILKQRYSIWRDWIYDFWKKIGNSLRGKESFVSTVQYIMTNSIVNLLIGIPALIILPFILTTSHLNTFQSLCFQHVLLCLMIFLITSFRKTRFLGEPERYVEFAIGFLAIGLYNLDVQYPSLFQVIIIFSLTFIFFRLFALRFLLSRLKTSRASTSTDTGSVSRSFQMEEILSLIRSATPIRKETKMISNFTDTTKFLLSPDYQTFRHPLFQEYIGPFHYLDVHRKSYFKIELDDLKKIIRHFSIDILVYLVNDEEGDEWKSLTSEFSCKFLFENSNFKVLQFEPKP